jgi:hypothetical protein
MCCNGSLHNWSNLRQAEVATAKELGLQVFTLPAGTPAFHQPCAAFKEPVCVIYSQRPQACREYACHPLERLEAGSLSLEEALRHTQRAKELITALRLQMQSPDPRLGLERQVLYQWLRAAPPPEAAAILQELRALLREEWGVRWHPFKKS